MEKVSRRGPGGRDSESAGMAILHMSTASTLIPTAGKRFALPSGLQLVPMNILSRFGYWQLKEIALASVANGSLKRSLAPLEAVTSS